MMYPSNVLNLTACVWNILLKIMFLRLFIFWTIVYILPHVFSSDETNETEEDDDDYVFTEKPDLKPLDPILITQINNAKLSWTAGPNFKDKLIIELKMLAGSLTLAKDTAVVKYRRHNITTIPKFFDARQKWPHCPTLRTIPSQGRCSSCWAVIPASVISDRTCIATGSTVTLSAEEYMICCKDCMRTPPNGCYGGDPLKAFLFWAKKGLVSGGDIQNFIGCRPYSKFSHFNSRLRNFSCHDSCTNRFYNGSYILDKHYGRVVYKVLESVEQIQMEIMTNGPVNAEMQIYADFYLYYSGVYVHYVGDSYHLTHSVKLLGWGEENNTPYWLATNSWGQKWGKEGGFFKILRGKNHCGIETRIIAGDPRQPGEYHGPRGLRNGTKAPERMEEKTTVKGFSSGSSIEHCSLRHLFMFIVYDFYFS